MGEVIWVEVLTRHRDVAARHRFERDEVLVGRGYDNDVVIDDPYVSSRHLRIVRGADGALSAEDLGSANGLFADRSRERQSRIALDGNKPIRIGHTFIRVRDSAHEVAPERVARPRQRSWLVAFALAAAILGVELLHLWLTDFTDGKPSRYLLPLLYIGLFVSGWSAVWAVLARIFSGHAEYERNLLITLALVLTWSVFNELVDLSGFALSWRLLADYEFVALWLLLAAASFLHLYVIRPTRLRLKGGLVAGLAAVAIATQGMARNDVESAFDRLAHARPLKPPSLRLTPLGDSRSFLDNLDRLRRKIDEDRRSQRAESDEDLDD